MPEKTPRARSALDHADRTPAGRTPGRSAGSTLGSTAAGLRMRPSPPTSPSSTTRGEPQQAPRRQWPRRASGSALPESRARPGNGTARVLAGYRCRGQAQAFGAADLAAVLATLPPGAGLLFMAGMRGLFTPSPGWVVSRTAVIRLRWLLVREDSTCTGAYLDAGDGIRAATGAGRGAEAQAGGGRPFVPLRRVFAQVPRVRGRTPGLPPAGRPPAPLAVRLSCSNGSPIAAPLAGL